MKGLWMDLPPFSPDTSGFASALSDTDGMGLIDDVRGCAGNYYLYEETRSGLPIRVFTSELNNEDAILGTRNALIRKFQEKVETLSPCFALLCAGPISSLIGTDLALIAKELEAAHGIPVSWVDITGHSTYDIGLAKTLEVFARCLSCQGEAVPLRVNVLGANALDWASQDLLELSHWAAEDGGLEIAAVYGGAVTLDQLRASGSACLNWVVNVSGLRAAQWMKSRYGIPYLKGAPFGRAGSEALLRRIRSGTAQEAVPSGCPANGRRALIIDEQYAGNALRKLLLDQHGFSQVRVCSFFQMDRDCMAPGDLHLKGEQEFRELAAVERDSLIIGDSVLRRCAPTHCDWLDLFHAPISAGLYAGQRPALLGSAADQWLREELEKL